MQCSAYEMEDLPQPSNYATSTLLLCLANKKFNILHLWAGGICSSVELKAIGLLLSLAAWLIVMRVAERVGAMNEDITLLKENRNQIAVRYGLPPIGALMVNEHGIEWLVDGHLHLPTLATIARRGMERDDDEDPQDLYPVILPQNLSPRLTDFIAET